MEQEPGCQREERFQVFIKLVPCANTVNGCGYLSLGCSLDLESECQSLFVDVGIAHGQIEADFTDQTARVGIEEINPMLVPVLAKTRGPPGMHSDRRSDPGISGGEIQHFIPVVLTGGVVYASADSLCGHGLEDVRKIFGESGIRQMEVRVIQI